jgi:lipopolysaccharide transport system permease protein
MADSRNLPVVHIRPSRGWMALNLSEIWEYRELLYFLVWRNVKLRYRQTLLGFAWAFVNPVVNTIVFTVIFEKVARLPTDGLPGPVFFMIGLSLWRYFAATLSTISNSLVGSGNLLSKVYFPRLLIPLNATITGLADYFIALGLLIALMLWLHVVPAASVILLPVLLLLTIATALGVGLFFAALNVRYRDVGQFVPFLTSLWMYASVIIPFSQLPERWGVWRYLYGLNPMAGIIEGCRWCFAHHVMTVAKAMPDQVLSGLTVPETLAKGQEIVVKVLDGVPHLILKTTIQTPPEAPWLLIGMGLPFTIGALVFGLYYFKRVEKMFADII